LNLTFGRIHFQIPHGADLWQDPLSNPAWRGSDRADCGSLKFECDSTLRALPRGIGELPWIEALTALQELERNIANYNIANYLNAISQITRKAVVHSLRCRARCRACSICKSFASKLPTWTTTKMPFWWLYGQRTCLPSAAHSRPGAPLPLLHVVDVDDDDAEEKMRLSTCW